MQRFINDIFGRKTRPIVSRKPVHSPRLCVEQLEERAVPAVLFKNQFGPEALTNLATPASLKSPEVFFIFWGSFWNSEAGLQYKTSLINEAKGFIGSHALEGLQQYGSDGKATYNGSWTIATSEP